MSNSAGTVISTILKHDAKVTSYKIALLRAINDVVLSFPDIRNYNRDVAIPLRMLAEFWIAYYWPFVESVRPILQGPQFKRVHGLTNDISFRPYLTKFRLECEKVLGGVSRPSDGFFIISELRVPRKRALFSAELLEVYDLTLKSIIETLQMPIRHAGPGQWTVFCKPARYAFVCDAAVPIPGTQDYDMCLIIKADLWQAFHELSLWIEALCIHEWSLFSENVTQENNWRVDRGNVYRLLTDRPDNRRPLTWERNNIDLLIMEGKEFICPWTERRISKPGDYDMDHLVPVSIYPINELWNLVPTDSKFNTRIKRDRLPSREVLSQARPHLTLAYSNYSKSSLLSQAISEDVAVRFSTVRQGSADFPDKVTIAVIDFIDQIAESRNLARF